MKLYKLQHAPYLKGGGRLELVLTSVSVLSIKVSVVIEVSTPLRTRFLMFLCGKDRITRTGMVIVVESPIFLQNLDTAHLFIVLLFV